jgi:hypothetical protein
MTGEITGYFYGIVLITGIYYRNNRQFQYIP